MKITFVHLGREHLGIEYLSSVLKKAGHETSLAHDPGIFGPEDNVFCIPPLERFFSRKKEVIAKIEKTKPDLVAFSVYTGTYPWARDVARAVKGKTNAKTVFGGLHATLVPEIAIKEEVADFVIVGEGEYALLDLAEAISSGKAYYDIPNLCYKKEGAVVKNPPREPIRDLDSLPFPDKELFEADVDHGQDYMIVTSRGCKFNCSFCCECYFHKIYGNRYFRRRGIASVMDELKRMKERYDFKRVMFFDSVFFTDKRWLEDFLREYKREVSVPFRCEGHVAFSGYDMVRMMKDSGCYGIDFGVQTFNEDIRRKILNRPETNDEIEKAFAACDKAGLRYDVDLILALPSMTEDDYALPLKFMDSHKRLNRIKCFYLSYYPRLPIVDKAKESGIIDDSDIEGFERGEVGDFFHKDSIKDPADRAMKDNFEKFYKIYPLIPAPVRRFITRKKLYRQFHFLPKPLVILAQLAIGILKNDLRFYTHINNYLIQIRKRFGYGHTLSRK